MSVFRRVLQSLLLIGALTCAQSVNAQPRPPEPQGEFVPMTEVPPEEQLPAQPLLAAAYGFVWLALFAYLISIARRLGRVHAEIERLEADLQRSTRG